MRKPLLLFATASLATGSLAFLGYDKSVFADDKPAANTPYAAPDRSAQGAAQGNLPLGVTRIDKTDEAGIRTTLATAVQDALSQGNLTNLTQCFTSADQKRLAEFGKDNKQLSDKISQLCAEFKTKYNQDFSLKDKQEVVFGNQYKDFIIVQGEVSNPALLSNWPVNATGAGGADINRSGPGTSGEGTKSQTGKQGAPGATGTDRATVGGPGQPSTVDRGTAGTATPAQPQEQRGTVGGPGQPSTIDRGLAQGAAAAPQGIDRGMNIAVVTFPSGHGAPELNVSLVRETIGAAPPAEPASGQWKLDIPDSITAEQLQSNLIKHIDMMLNHKDQWAADADEAYRAISHHVLFAFYDEGAAGGAKAPANGEQGR